MNPHPPGGPNTPAVPARRSRLAAATEAAKAPTARSSPAETILGAGVKAAGRADRSGPSAIRGPRGVMAKGLRDAAEEAFVGGRWRPAKLWELDRAVADSAVNLPGTFL